MDFDEEKDLSGDVEEEDDEDEQISGDESLDDLAEDEAKELKEDSFDDVDLM